MSEAADKECELFIAQASTGRIEFRPTQTNLESDEVVTAALLSSEGLSCRH